VRAWLLLEHSGPWGIRALHDARLPDGLGERLRRLGRRHRFRTLLIRRPGRDPDPGTTCFAIRSGPGDAWIERAELGGLDEACDLDLAALGLGERPGLTPHTDPLFLVCTHGRHDACCAERGRPLALGLAAELPEETWECSHVGGDRFAANLLAFPHGIYFGRVAPAHGAEVARSYAQGLLDLDALRGRSCYPMDVQAADHALRKELGLRGIGEVVVELVERDGDETRVRFGTPDGPVTVRLLVGLGAPVRLTCRSERDEAPPVYEVLAISARR
jgi:hypothetical protein